MLNLLRFQYATVYFYAGLAKLGSDWLVHAQPLGIWLYSRGDTPVSGSVPLVERGLALVGVDCREDLEQSMQDRAAQHRKFRRRLLREKSRADDLFAIRFVYRDRCAGGGERPRQPAGRRQRNKERVRQTGLRKAAS